MTQKDFAFRSDASRQYPFPGHGSWSVRFSGFLCAFRPRFQLSALQFALCDTTCGSIQATVAGILGILTELKEAPMAAYRLPFPSEGPASSWLVANGNWDQNPGHGAPQGVATDGQAYAVDILHGIGGKLLAARAGVVLDLGNNVPDHTNPPGEGAGNWIWIRHGDGTIGVYLHLKKDSL